MNARGGIVVGAVLALLVFGLLLGSISQQQHAASLRAEADLVTARAEARLLDAATLAVRADTQAAHGVGSWFPVVFALAFGFVAGALPLGLLAYFLVSTRREALNEQRLAAEIERRMDDE